ncbi:MAG: tyrosine-protein phosphatase [Synergistaceae bacterium]|nr:tyrosine-protein phosphatase [Synergistaceae bacterium]
MKRSHIFVLLTVIIIAAFSSPCYPAESFGKTFYRSLSARLGRNRDDYPNLTDSEFANFRMVKTSGIAPGKLFRSSSPISTWGSRNAIADSESRKAGISTFINLADSDEGMKQHKGYSGSYYSTRKIIGLNLRMKYKSPDFRRRLARGIRFMAANEPPYLVHCSLGKDRAGFVCAVIECLAGSSWPEVERDYMASFRNYFGILPGTREYDFVVKNEIARFIAENFGIDNPAGANLYESAERYIRGLGVSQQDIDTLRRKLGG